MTEPTEPTAVTLRRKLAMLHTARSAWINDADRLARRRLEAINKVIEYTAEIADVAADCARLGIPID